LKVPLPERERDFEGIRLPFSQNGRRGWGMRARRIVIFMDYS